MKIFNTNLYPNYLKQREIKAQPKLNNIATDTISFSAKIPQRIKAELKYQGLTRRDIEGNSNQLYSSTNPEILTLLRELKDDKDVTDEFKEKILRGDTQREYPLSIRIQLSKRDDEKTKFNL